MATKLITAIEEAMTDYMEHGETFTPVNPVIAQNCEGYEYDSGLRLLFGGSLVCDLSGGFGSWTPQDMDDIPACAAGFAAEVVIG